MEDMIVSIKFLRTLHRHEILGILNNADGRSIPSFVLTYPAWIRIGDVAADGAVVQIPFDTD